MDISTIQSATLPSHTTTQRNIKEQGDFASVLEDNNGVSVQNEQTASISHLVQSALVNSVELVSTSEVHPIDAVERILESMQEYIDDLANTQEPKSLLELHKGLNRIEQAMHQFNAKYSIQADDPLYSILNSLEILILQERYRFNRGTYIS